MHTNFTQLHELLDSSKQKMSKHISKTSKSLVESVTTTADILLFLEFTRQTLT